MQRIKAKPLHFVLILAFLLVACGSDNKSSKEVNPTIFATNVRLTPANSVVSSPLNAGEIDDNSQWGHYLNYRNTFLTQYGSQAVRDVDVSARQVITVTDAQGLPVLGARVLVYSGQNLLAETRTYATGQTLFAPSAWQANPNEQGYRVVVEKGESTVEFNLNPTADSHWDVVLNTATAHDIVQLDVLFLLDATGSMGDEIAQLQNNILAISSQIDELQGNVDVRYGLVTYRDREDEFVTRKYDFVSDVTVFQSKLSTVAAVGGGDKAESLNEGLHVAVEETTWRGDDTIKLIFLVTDAAPHLDYANDYDYSHEMIGATWRGIKIHPIASSGLDDGDEDNAEFVLRQIAQYTMGHFIFLTYDNGTAGNPGTERTEVDAAQDGNYSVEQLDELVLRLIKDEIAALSVPVSTSGIIAQTQPVTQTIPQTHPTFNRLVRTAYQAVEPSADIYSTRTTPPDEDYPNTPIGMSIMFGLFLLSLMSSFLLAGLYFGTQKRDKRRKMKNEEMLRLWQAEERLDNNSDRY